MHADECDSMLYPARRKLLRIIHGLSAAIGTGAILYAAASSMLALFPTDIRLVVAINFDGGERS
jgi:hypothetical protein